MSATSPPQRVERRARRPRDEWEAEILVSARRTFAEEGYDVSINEIIERSGAPVGTFYRLFSDKDVLFARVMQDLGPRYIDEIERGVEQACDDAAIDDGDPWRRFRATVETMITVGAGEFSDVARLYFSDVRGLGPSRSVARSVESAERALLVEAIADALQAEDATCESPEFTAVAVLGAVRRVTEEYVTGRDDPPVEIAAGRMADLLISGVRGDVPQEPECSRG
ncbi:MAG: TetR/AcrR family transcriptional regulator [Acidimicrobiia bacterium]